MTLYESETYIKDLKESIKSSVGIDGLKNTRILVTGASGTIGSFIVDMLLEYNKNGAMIEIFAAGRSIEHLNQRFGYAKTEYLTYVQYDMLSPVRLDMPIDYIIHAAGNAHPAAFNGDPVGTIIGNINGTYALLEYAKKYGAKRFCYISSGEVYGQGDLTIDSFKEEYSGYLELLSPRSCYPMSKRAAETLCVSYTKQYGLETVIVRPCHTYGPGMTGNDSRANAQFIRNVLNGENIVLKSAGTQMRSYCYIADCASAIISCLTTGKTAQAYNSANSDARITIAGLAEVIADCAGKKVVFAHPETIDLKNQTPIEKQVLNVEKLEALGWKGRYSIKEGIMHTLAILEGK